jgi:two-component system response regulator QseB
MRILLVEDDEIVGKAVCHSLQESHYEVKWLQEGDAIESLMLSREYSALILDVTLPTYNGLDILKNLRSKGVEVPILLLSSRNAAEDIVQGLNAGADMYMPKPFALSVLLANVHALLRRTGHARMLAPVPMLEQAGLKLDPNSYSVYIEGERISVSRREYSLLNKLLENMGEVVPRETLSQCIYGDETEVESNAVEVHVHNLRKKLRANIIKTIRGVGYIVDAPRGVSKPVSAASFAVY